VDIAAVIGLDRTVLKTDVVDEAIGLVKKPANTEMFQGPYAAA
jgi:hypothetical protein